MKTQYWRDPILDIENSVNEMVVSHTLGTLKAGVVVRIPIWLANWLRRREQRKQQERDAIEDEAIHREYIRRVQMRGQEPQP